MNVDRDASRVPASVRTRSASARVAKRSFENLRLISSTQADDVYRNRFRERRLQRFLAIVDEVLALRSECRIFDVGGMVDYWQNLSSLWSGRNLTITITNLGPATSLDDRFTYLQGDARCLTDLRDNEFDVVHSNSMMEHVGGWQDKQAVAAEIRRLAPRYFVQTPNFWFPFEPHMRLPVVHWLPRSLQRRIVMSRPCGFYGKASSMEEAQHILADADMLDRAEMVALFPDAEVMAERFGPLVKSWIAVR